MLVKSMTDAFLSGMAVFVCFAFAGCYEESPSPFAAVKNESAAHSDSDQKDPTKNSANEQAFNSKTTHAEAAVRLEKSDDGWQLIRNGKPFQIKGAGGTGSLELLAESGGNSIRTWGVDDKTESLLDQAHQLGLTVCVGLWLGHERHGFDYSDYDQVTRQIDETLAHVKKLKDHPAVLMWGVGNEMEGYESGDNPAIWQHVEFLARRIKELDPNHPTITVIAEMGGRKVEAIHKLCPSIDIVGVNSYAGSMSVPKRYRKLNGTKPYVVTEFGPHGPWEVSKNAIGAVKELSSTSKAENYRATYRALEKDTEYCLGSYAFLWGNKQEATATWFGLLLADGKKTAAVDALTELWSGKPPANLCPQIESLKLIGEPTVEKNQTIQLELKASDPEQQDIHVKWVLTEDPGNYVTGGDLQREPKSFPDAILKSDESSAEIRMPDNGGLYRVYAYVDDGNNAAAVANVALMVKGAVLAEPGNKTELPHVVYNEPGTKTVFAPSGWMGNTDAIELDPEHKTQPHQGEHCIRCQFSKADGWGGVVWLHPENDWGDQPGGVDLTDATELSFWARGEKGGEAITFGLGLLGREKKYFDTTKKEILIKLTPEWREYTIKLTGADLTRIKSGFYWSLAGQGESITFYLDDIEYRQSDK